jgi:predicted GIY-YIG superfamily endonuclease
VLTIVSCCSEHQRVPRCSLHHAHPESPSLNLGVRSQCGTFALLTQEIFGDSCCKATPEDKLPKKPKIESKLEGAWFVYLLRCGDDSLYTGITNDLPRRVEQHNAGKTSRYTRSRLPVVLVYQETQASRSLALKRELTIKSFSRLEMESMIKCARLPQR